MSAKDDIKRFKIETLPEIMHLDRDRVALAKKRQAAFWRGERTDAPPVMCGEELTEEQEKIPAPNFEEAFYDSDLMLCGQMRAACAVANSKSDAVPSIRANMGTGTMISLMGLNQDVFPDKMPWLRSHFTKEQISKMTPDDIQVRGDYELGIKHMKRFKEVMGDFVGIYCMDTQGPFDLAHLMMGDDLFMELHDDPPFVHHLMELCLQIGIKSHTWMKELTGEPMDQFCHSNSLYAENMGIRICEDTTAIIGPDAMETYAMPYTRRLAVHFGGAWIHYCGKNDHLTRNILDIPEIRGINFGHIPGHVHDHVFEEEMERCLEARKVFFGSWPARDGESAKDYLKRLHAWTERGVLLANVDGALNMDDSFACVEELLDYWYNL